MTAAFAPSTARSGAAGQRTWRNFPLHATKLGRETAMGIPCECQQAVPRLRRLSRPTADRDAPAPAWRQREAVVAHRRIGYGCNEVAALPHTAAPAYLSSVRLAGTCC